MKETLLYLLNQTFNVLPAPMQSISSPFDISLKSTQPCRLSDNINESHSKRSVVEQSSY